MQVSPLYAGDFCREYSKAVFVIHEPDKARLRAYLLNGAKRKRKYSKAEINKLNESYWRTHCRHSIPEPEELVAAVEAVMRKFAGGVCAKTQEPLITEEVQKVHNLQVELMKQGLLSGESLSLVCISVSASASACACASASRCLYLFVSVSVFVSVSLSVSPCPCSCPCSCPCPCPCLCVCVSLCLCLCLCGFVSVSVSRSVCVCESPHTFKRETSLIINQERGLLAARNSGSK
jgi:hypothetical protein